MNPKTQLRFVLIFLVSLAMLTGCGSSSSNKKDTNNSNPPTQVDSGSENNNTAQNGSTEEEESTQTVTKTKGYLIDSPLEGVSYICGDGAEGITDSEGMFECAEAPVVFKIGNLTLGTLTAFTADGKVYPQDLLGLARDNYTDSRLKLLARLLQSLDDDGKIDTKITITADIRTKFTTEQDFKDMTKSDIEALLSGVGKSLSNECGALKHLGDSSVSCNSDGSYYVYTPPVSSGGGSSSSGGTTTQKTTIKGKVVDDPIIGATVKVLSLSNEELKTATTDSNGSYSLDVDKSKITNGFILEATGGQMNGVDFNETLRAIYGADDSLENANVTLLTTLVAKMAKDAINRSGTLLDKRDEALQKLSDMGMLKKADWFGVEPSLVNMEELRAVVQGDGLGVWLDGMVADLSDNQLGRDKMRVFSKAHGGVLKISASNEFISIFSGQEKEVSLSVELAETNSTDIVFHKVSGVSWVTIQNNKMLIAPPSDLTTYDDFTIEIETLVNNVSTGRTKQIVVSLVKKVILLSGELGSEGGKIENQWKDISISVDANKLTQTYQIEYNAGLTKNGHLSLWFKMIPDMNRIEMSNLNILQPSYDIIKRNYLEDNQNAIQSRSLRSGGTYEYSVWNSRGVPSECRSGVVNGRINEMVWTDENNDGTTFPFVWQGTMAVFDSDIERVGEGLSGGNPRVQLGKPVFGAELLCASALRSEVSDTADISTKEAVLFVHGFISSGKLGGYDHGDGEVGGEYFAKFPNILGNYENEKYIPFVFQWRTNAKFEDVASELGRAIKQISTKTGKKVHIVAHSFGGLLSRTLIQGLATSSYYDKIFSEKHIASLTTVGTPHSGTFGSKTTVNFDDEGDVVFPEGRNGVAGGAIELCRAITCYETGSGFLENSPQRGIGGSILYGTKQKKGYVVYKLFKELDSYPSIPTQVLLGLVPESIKAERTNENEYKIIYDFLDDEAIANPGIGDKLISFFGQRILPDGDQTDLNEMYNEGNIEEHILQMDEEDFTRGDDDDIVNEYRAGLLTDDDWTIDNYRTGLTFEELRFRFSKGYNHRTGEYTSSLTEITDPHNALKKVKILNYTQSEVGLQNCLDSDICDNSTWNYFKTFIDKYPAEAINPPSKIVMTGDVKYRGANNQVVAKQTRSLNRSTSAVPFPVTVEAYTGSSLMAMVSTNQRTTLKDDGSYELNVTYSPDTNYTVIAYPEGDTVARVGAFVRATASKFLTTFGTLEESTLHFPTITLTDGNYEEGTLNVKVTDGTSGTVLNGFKAEILNSTGVNVDEENTESINSGYVTTQPKGDYTVKISKDGYNRGEAQCTVKADETTACIVNIVSSAVIANGQITAVLSWGANPSDLDSHLVRKTNGNQDYHIYYSNKNGIDANLDRDDTSSYGPETITISNVNQDSIYTYYVYNFSGGAGSVLPNSGAKLELNFNGGQRTFTVPNEEGRYWKVFEIDNGRIIPCTTGCVKNDTSTLIRRLDRESALFRNLPSK